MAFDDDLDKLEQYKDTAEQIQQCLTHMRKLLNIYWEVSPHGNVPIESQKDILRLICRVVTIRHQEDIDWAWEPLVAYLVENGMIAEVEASPSQKRLQTRREHTLWVLGLKSKAAVHAALITGQLAWKYNRMYYRDETVYRSVGKKTFQEIVRWASSSLEE